MQANMQAKMHVAACIFDAKTYQGQAKTIFCQLARQLLVFSENHKISRAVILRRPGGMRGGAGGRFEGGLRSADLRFAISDLWFGSDTPALAIRQGRRIQSLRAFRQAEKREEGRGKRDEGRGKKEERRGRREGGSWQWEDGRGKAEDRRGKRGRRSEDLGPLLGTWGSFWSLRTYDCDFKLF